MKPTNDCLAGQDHIMVARGGDHADVTPVAGILRSSEGGQGGGQAVDVIPMEEALP